MKVYTEKEALEEIFNSKNLSPSLRVLKTRYKRGTLMHETKKQILENNKFVVCQETTYKKA